MLTNSIGRLLLYLAGCTAESSTQLHLMNALQYEMPLCS